MPEIRPITPAKHDRFRVWQNRSEVRLNDYQQDEQIVGKYIDVLYQSVISNRGLDMQKV